MDNYKTPAYTRRAIEKYRSSKEQIMLTMDKGTKDRIKAITTKSVSGFISELVLKELERLENKNN